ncbi:MAG: tetratricopeptide repeat protein [Flavobacteriales bacterium]|jgi:thioredoxin-like negative regulator of GroEL|nr:tetratricopeptide repeat protein [Flavobacteriales bacterium]MCB0757695.1 tetratricopeptide repeat protein [Flavobacteriales bacterium]
MSSNRLEQLRSMLAEEPGDPFLRYAIALERWRAGDREGAAADLESLLREDPTYVACYYQLAQVLAELGRTEDAVHTCHAGALQCLVTGDRKTRAELLSLKEDLEDTA